MAQTGAEVSAGPSPGALQLEAQFLQALEQTEKDIAGLESELAAETRNLEEDEGQNKIYQARMTFLKNLVIMSGTGYFRAGEGPGRDRFVAVPDSEPSSDNRQRSEKFRQTLLCHNGTGPPCWISCAGKPDKMTAQDPAISKNTRNSSHCWKKSRRSSRPFLKFWQNRRQSVKGVCRI